MCAVVDFLQHFTNGDREQFTVILNDRTRSPHIIARSLEAIEHAPAVNGIDILKHQQGTCDCHGFLD